MEKGLERIHWLGHAAFKITGDHDQVIYLDPFKINQGEKADLILISHGHYDHFSPEDIAKLRGAKTEVVGPPDCVAGLEGETTAVKPGETITAQGIKIEVVPAYNTNKSFHPHHKNWVGYVITVAGQKIYFAGDTDRIPEMQTIKADFALLPVSGTYVMTAEEAAAAALDLKPEVAIPMHYGKGVVGTVDDANRFKELLSGKVEVEIKKLE